MDYQLSTHNKRIYDFYSKYNFLDFEQINLLCVDLFENILQDATSTINKSLGSQILTECLETSTKVGEIIQIIASSSAKTSNDIYIKMLDIKREYVEEIKNAFNSGFSNKLEQNNRTIIGQINLETVSLITERVLDKTHLLLNQVVPESNNHIIKQVQDDIQKCYGSMNEDLKLLIKESAKSEQMSALLSNFQSKHDQMMQSIQSPILQVLSMNDERINKNINKQQETQEKMLSSLEEFLNKYKNNSSLKGKYSENLLQKVIVQMFPTSEIIDTSKLVHSGDIIVKRENKNDILFENKDYADNVSAEEVNKFILDCEKRKVHGIILSQNTGITSKKNYHIDIKGGKVLVYVHNVDYAQHKIQIAVDIIDTLAEKLKGVDQKCEESENTISKEILEEINAEVSKFIVQKEAIINVVKDCQKKIIDEIKTLSFPTLERFLSNKFGGDQITYTCDVCNMFSALTKKQLASHKRTKECKSHCKDKIHCEEKHNREEKLNHQEKHNCEEKHNREEKLLSEEKIHINIREK